MNTFIICLLWIYGVVMLMMCFLQYYTTYSNKKKSINKAHFYIVRDFDNVLLLYLGYPYKSSSGFYTINKGCFVTRQEHFYKLGLDVNDYANLKWEDEPIEVFVNM